MKTILTLAFYFYILAVMAQLQPVKSGVYKWEDHPVKCEKLTESRKILEGSSPHFEYLEIYAITKCPGAKATTSHANDDIEACIIIKEGLMKATLDGHTSVLGTGGVFLLMPKHMFSIKNIGDTNLTYYMMRYRSKKKVNIARGKLAGGSLLLNPENLVSRPNSSGASRSYFNRPTAMCQRFEMHVTRIDSIGARHPAHKHIESEIILVISGRTKQMIDGKSYEGAAGDFYFMPSQSLHSVSNTRDTPCTYFAFKWN